MNIQLDCQSEIILARLGRPCLHSIRRAVNPMRRALFALGFFVTMAAPALSDDLVGQASIIDGDTLEIHGTRIRQLAVPLRREDGERP
jgi:endonuclease YncB( thermonuclease family)